jgi:hypothetical protein
MCIRISAIFLVAVMAVAGCTGQTASTAPSTAPASAPPPTAAPLAVGEFASHGVAANLDARGAGADVTGTMTMSNTGNNATVDLECSHTTESGLLIIGGLVTDSTFIEYFPKGHRVAIVLQPGSPVQAVWYIVLPGDAPLASCQAVVDALVAEGTELNNALEPIEGTVEFGPKLGA